MAGMADGRRSPKITADEKLFIDSLAEFVRKDHFSRHPHV
jgi:hypothetical protein